MYVILKRAINVLNNLQYQRACLTGLSKGMANWLKKMRTVQIFQLLINRSNDKELDRCCLVANNSMGILGKRKIATDSLGYGGIDRSLGFLHLCDSCRSKLLN